MDTYTYIHTYYFLTGAGIGVEDAYKWEDISLVAVSPVTFIRRHFSDITIMQLHTHRLHGDDMTLTAKRTKSDHRL